MKTVVLGDIHGRTIWKDIVLKHHDADRFVFLGDYVSSREDISSEQQISNLMDIVEFAINKNESKPNSVILLRGNHDLQHLGYYWARCSNLNGQVAKWMSGYADTFLENTQWVFVENDIVYSHAGVTQTWMDMNGLTDIHQINELAPSEIFGFTPCKLSDYRGDSHTQPPTWVRPWTLLEYSFGNYTYIVGHTPTESAININSVVLESEYGKSMYDELKDKNQVWTCDCLEDGGYILVEDGIIVPCKFLE